MYKNKRYNFAVRLVIAVFFGLLFVGWVWSKIDIGNVNTIETSKIVSNSTQSLKRERQVKGKATDLGAGTFECNRDITEGLYDVTPVDGQGNFIIQDKKGDELGINEILWAGDLGVKKVRVNISNGDKIQLQGINETHFEPVTVPFITDKKTVTLYSGEWTVGEDVAQGRYLVGDNKSQASNFIILDKSGAPRVNEIIGLNGVKSVTLDLKDGDMVKIDNSNGITLTPQ